ncbi:hypothetical protein FMN52_00805 [Marinobacter sp. BW6]|uniref:hypothetical protein n=1 Tax=Marinobacter sp. BW6 TaxID=2592624 RepID=UPI0011DEE31F|nr:hypothetical protein [Marinobacter sp. BW6]TYC63796.1 hypothetical protein FMN52_00805 [Marinobacter sp. BW6]
MAAITIMIIGAAIGGQLGTVGAIVGAYIGLALATPIKQTSTFSNIDCGTENKSTLGWIPDFPPAASYSPLANYETPTLHQDVINDSSTLFDDPMSSSEPSHINPATGLPMIDDGITGFDVGGNTFGTSSDDFM